MGNVYKDHEDTTIKGMLDEMYRKLKNPGGGTPLTFHDRSKPSGNSPDPAPLKITKAVPQRITLKMPWE